MYYMLLYDYVDNMLERRAPFRDEHLALARASADRGELILAGAFDEPVDGAALVFKVEDRARIDAFVDADPYVQNNLVVKWRIRPWTVVIGAEAK